jgi:hypothetical protein
LVATCAEVGAGSLDGLARKFVLLDLTPKRAQPFAEGTELGRALELPLRRL